MSRSLINDIFQTSIAKNSAFFLKILVGVFIARYYGPEGRGYLAAFLVIPELMVIVGSLSIHEGILYRLAKKTLSSKTFVLIMFFVVSVQIPILLLIMYFLSGFVSNVDGMFDLFLFLFLIPVYVLQEIVRFSLRGVGKTKQYNVSVVLEIVVYSFVAACLIYFHADLKFVIASLILGSLLSTIYCYMHVKSGVIKNNILNVSEIVNIYKYSLHVHIFRVLNALQAKLPILFISFYMSLSELGLFTVAATFGLVLQMCIQGPVSIVILPRLVEMGDFEAAEFTSKVTRLMFFVGLLFFLFMVVAGDFLLKVIFGESFSDAYMVMLVLLLGMIMKTPMATLNCYFKARGNPEVLGSVSLFVTPVLILSTIILIPLFGILGAAISIFISSIVFSVLMLRRYRLVSNKKLVDVILVKMSDIRMITNAVGNYFRCRKL